MSLPTSRLLAALELLQARRRVTGAELADRLQVDRRTARRYVARLVAMGVPVEGERGRDGAYRLAAGYKLPPMMFSDEEALALSVGLVAARDLGLDVTPVAVDSALAKLERVMPELLRTRMRSVERAVRLDLGSGGRSGRAAALAMLSDAIQRQQRVRLRYQATAPDGTREPVTQRDVDPYGLAYTMSHWYVVGHCHLRGAQRSFRLDRIVGLKALPASFVPPPQFDALAALRRSLATLPRRHAVKLVLHTSLPEARARLGADFGVMHAMRARHGALRVGLQVQVDDLAWLARELAALPCDFEIRKPAALARALQAHAQRLLEAAAGRR